MEINAGDSSFQHVSENLQHKSRQRIEKENVLSSNE